MSRPTLTIHNQVLVNDLVEFAEKFPFLSEMRGKAVLVTGATGLIGSLLVYALSMLNHLFDAGISIYALARNKEKAFLKFGNLPVIWIFQDINNPLNLNDDVDYIFHCAAITESRLMVENPVEVLSSLITGTGNILDWARRNPVKSMVYLSSIETYGSFNKDFPVMEGDAGFIDPLNPRSSYSLGKKTAECLCNSYFKEYEVPVKIARLTQTFGAGVDKTDNRVFAQFARSAVKGEDIVLHTTGESAKPYCHTTDALRALFYILLTGDNGEAYNVANPHTFISVKDMAEMVAELGSGLKVVFDLKNDRGYAPPSITRLDVKKLTTLGWSPTIGLKDMFRSLIEYLKEEDAGTLH